MHQRPAQAYENANHAVDELLQTNLIRISRIKREMLERIASENLKGHFPTSKDVFNHLPKYNKEYLKKQLTALKKKIWSWRKAVAEGLIDYLYQISYLKRKK